jgi:YD repeat-containing protein
MIRNDSGDLLSVTTPSGKWLHFEYDERHRIRSIMDSEGRSMRYEYDPGGRLARVTDSDGHVELYTYNDRNEMLSVADGARGPVLLNEYTSSNLISKQTLSDGRRFEYSYAFGTRMVIHQNLFAHPNGLNTFFDYNSDGYFQSLPTRLPQ